MRKLVLFAIALGLTLAAASSQAVGYPPCNTGCPTTSGLCLCPSYTDRPKAVSFCAGWNTVGGCWYE